MHLSRRDFLKGTATTALALSQAIKLVPELKPGTFQSLEGAWWKYVVPSGGDDTAMINAAIRAAPPGETVLLGPGIFKIDGMIELFMNSHLSGTCDEDNVPTSSLVKNGNADDPLMRCSGSCEIRNLDITCPSGPAVEYLPSWTRESNT
jgi:hypothetical protein